MQKFIAEVKNMVTENDLQYTVKHAVIDTAETFDIHRVETVLDRAIVNARNSLDRLFFEKIYKMLDRYVVTKRIIDKFSIN
jgi:hypothetical protein